MSHSLRWILRLCLVAGSLSIAPVYGQKAPAAPATAKSKGIILDALCICLAERRTRMGPAAAETEARAQLDYCYFATAAHFQSDFDTLYGDYLDISSDKERAQYLARILPDLQAYCPRQVPAAWRKSGIREER